MKTILTILLFCIVLFFYLHIHFQLKVSNDLEVFELENPTFSKIKIEQLCDLRQPVVFDFPEDIVLQSCSYTFLVSQYPTFDLNIRENNENDENKSKAKAKERVETKTISESAYFPLPLKDCIQLFKKDESETYFSENNSSFLEETGIAKKILQKDKYLRPPMTSTVSYDILMGSGSTPLRYEVSYRNYFILTSGKVRIKLFPPKSSHYLHESKDYENFEFISPINVWKVQSEYKDGYERVKSIDVDLTIPGKAIYIPAYWWYSIQFLHNTSVVVNCKYKTYMNIVAVLPDIGMYFLQNHNIVAKTKIIQKKEILKNENDTDTNETNETKNVEV